MATDHKRRLLGLAPKARTGDSTTDTVYAGWYSSVYMPTVEEDDPQTQPSGQQEIEDDETGGETL